MDEKKLKKGSLHGDVPAENKAEGASNMVDAAGDMGETIRKAEVLHYLKAGDVDSQLSAMGKDFIVHTEVDEIYPGAKD